MRITNQMISGNSLRNMQKSMSAVNKVTQQMTTGKKISQASEDPVIAIRALKLRTTVNQLDQYKEKNIPDAQSWYEITSTSLTNITKRIESVEDYCVQGSTDSFNSTDRGAIIDALKQLKDMIYKEGNSSYAGRYLFSGYKTDRPLTFTETENTDIYSYDIKQTFTAKDFETKNVVVNSVQWENAQGYIAAPNTYQQPDPKMVYKLALAYDEIEEKNNAGDTVLKITAKDASGNNINISGLYTRTLEANQKDQYYDVASNGVNIIKETGEIILGEAAYNLLKTAASIEVDYAKTKFDASDLRPEHYFQCTQYTEQVDGSDPKVINYTGPFQIDKETGEYVLDAFGNRVYDKQAIYYEVNFNQSVQVNTEGREVISHNTAAHINDLIDALQYLKDAEEGQVRLKAMLEDVNYSSNPDAVEQINRMLSDIDVEIAVRKENMQKTFSNSITIFQGYMSEVSSMISDVGSRMAKLSMIETRVTEQYAAFKELKSSNEDAETDEVIIDFNEAGLVYESALAATSRVMNKTLLDYL